MPKKGRRHVCPASGRGMGPEDGAGDALKGAPPPCRVRQVEAYAQDSPVKTPGLQTDGGLGQNPGHLPAVQ